MRAGDILKAGKTGLDSWAGRCIFLSAAQDKVQPKKKKTKKIGQMEKAG